jgi:hypothetical protein
MNNFLFASGRIRVDKCLFRKVSKNFIIFPGDPTRRVYYAKRNESNIMEIFHVLADTTILNIKVNIASEEVLIVEASSVGIFEIRFVDPA